MPPRPHLNGSKRNPQRRHFLTPKMSFSRFSHFDLCRGALGSQDMFMGGQQTLLLSCKSRLCRIHVHLLTIFKTLRMHPLLCHILLTLMLQLATVHHRPLPSQLLHFLLEMMFWNPSKMMCLHYCSTLCPNPEHEPN